MNNDKIIAKWLHEKAKEKTVCYHLTEDQIIDLLGLISAAIEQGDKYPEAQRDRLELTQHELLELLEDFDEEATY
ncbi:hypothetical protein ACFQ4J_06605 [Laceyella tengchongensis]|jgi:hypothetical protein